MKLPSYYAQLNLKELSFKLSPNLISATLGILVIEQSISITSVKYLSNYLRLY